MHHKTANVYKTMRLNWATLIFPWERIQTDRHSHTNCSAILLTHGYNKIHLHQFIWACFSPVIRDYINKRYNGRKQWITNSTIWAKITKLTLLHFVSIIISYQLLILTHTPVHIHEQQWKNTVNLILETFRKIYMQ